MAFCLANGVPVVSGELVLPRIGVWHAALELEDDTVQEGPVELAWWGSQLTLKGTVRYGGAENGASHLHVMGGAGGLTAAVAPKAYRNVLRRNVVMDLLGLAGESLSTYSDAAWLASPLSFYTLMESTVGRSLTLLVELQEGISWRVLANGKFWFGPEAWGEVDVVFEEISRNPRAYQMEVATETPALMPGCTFQGQRISTVTYRVTEHDWRVLLSFEAPDSAST
jgi:hypothetical protein